MNMVKVDMEIPPEMMKELSRQAEMLYIPLSEYVEMVLRESLEESEGPYGKNYMARG